MIRKLTPARRDTSYYYPHTLQKTTPNHTTHNPHRTPRSRLTMLLAVALGFAMIALALNLLNPLALSLSAQTPAGGPITYVVTSLNDATVEPGPPSCGVDCTLRDAIRTAADTPGLDIIEFAAGLTGDIELLQPLGINSDVIINGPGADTLSVSVAGNDFFNRRVLIVTGDSVTLRGLTIQRTGEGRGGGINNTGTFTVENSVIRDADYNGAGGAFHNNASGVLTLISSTISNSVALQGGGILNAGGSVIIIDSTLINNRASGAVNEGSALRNNGGVVSITDSLIAESRSGYALANFDSGSITIEGATIESNSAGGLYNEGSTSMVFINNSDFIGNVGGAIVNGGGIEQAVGGVIEVTASTLTGNRASGGGAILNRRGGTLTLLSSTLDGNSATFAGGGAILNQFNATITVRDSTLSNNWAGNNATFGGAIYNERGGQVVLENSTFSNNRADEVSDGVVNNFDSCGAIMNSGTNTTPEAAAFMLIRNSTISGNQSLEDGGAICAISQSGPDTSIMSIMHSTITGNRVLNPNDDDGGAGIYIQGGDVTLAGTILAGNTRGDSGALDNLMQHATSPGTITSQGYNLSDSAPAGFGASDLTNSPAGLAPLADNGGATLTHALYTGSAALDAADHAPCPATDQRGEPRPLDGDEDGDATCDIGAFEASETLDPPDPPEASEGVYLPFVQSP